MASQPKLTDSPSPSPTPPLQTSGAIAEWERQALAKLRALRAQGKPGILWMTEDGILLVFRAEKFGRIAP